MSALTKNVDMFICHHCRTLYHRSTDYECSVNVPLLWMFYIGPMFVICSIQITWLWIFYPGLLIVNVLSKFADYERSVQVPWLWMFCPGPLIVIQTFLPLLQQAVARDKSQGLSCSKAAIVNISSSMGSQTITFAHGAGTALDYKCVVHWTIS